MYIHLSVFIFIIFICVANISATPHDTYYPAPSINRSIFVFRFSFILIVFFHLTNSYLYTFICCCYCCCKTDRVEKHQNHMLCWQCGKENEFWWVQIPTHSVHTFLIIIFLFRHYSVCQSQRLSDSFISISFSFSWEYWWKRWKRPKLKNEKRKASPLIDLFAHQLNSMNEYVDIYKSYYYVVHENCSRKRHVVIIQYKSMLMIRFVMRRTKLYHLSFLVNTLDSMCFSCHMPLIYIFPTKFLLHNFFLTRTYCGCDLGLKKIFGWKSWVILFMSNFVDSWA